MLARFSIRTKITIVISLLLFALAGTGAFALKNMASINKSTVDISTNWLPSLRALGDIRASVLAYRASVRGFVLADDDAERNRIAKAMQGYETTLAEALKTYEPLVTESERVIAREFKTKAAEYMSGTTHVMALASKSEDKAARELNRTINAVGLKVDEVLQKAVDLNNAGAQAAGERAASSYGATFNVVLALLGLAIAVGSVAAYWLVRDISSGIRSIITPMQALGAGNLDAIVPHQHEKTEIGSMADALQVFKQALVDKRAADAVALTDAEDKTAAANASTSSPGISRT